MKFSIKDFHEELPADLATFTEEILNEKLRVLRNDPCFREHRKRTLV